MNEQLSNALADVLKASKDGVVNLALFAQQQAPELAKEIIQWGFWSNLIGVFIQVFVIWVVWQIWIKWANKACSDEDNPLVLMFIILGGILAVVMFVCFINSLETAIKCIVAPKLYLIDYVKSFVSSHK